MARTVLALALVAAALAGCGGEGTTSSDEGKLRVRDGVRAIGRTDSRTGLYFEVQTTRLSSTLSIRATRDLPAGVRTQVEGRRITATCAIPGTTVAALPRTWPDLAAPYVTTLQTRTPVPGADRVTTCTLRTKRMGAPFAQVTLR